MKLVELCTWQVVKIQGSGYARLLLSVLFHSVLVIRNALIMCAQPCVLFSWLSSLMDESNPAEQLVKPIYLRKRLLSLGLHSNHVLSYFQTSTTVVIVLCVKEHTATAFLIVCCLPPILKSIVSIPGFNYEICLKYILGYFPQIKMLWPKIAINYQLLGSTKLQ